MSKLFDDLCIRLNTQPGRDGEAILSPCQNCGKESKRGHVHCSFSERGWHCWCCSGGGTLADLARRIGVEGHVQAAPTPPPDRPKRPFEAGRYPSYHVNAGKYDAWAKYAPSLSPKVIDAYKLGVGAYPQYCSKCEHERLQVPLIVGGRLVGLRGRAISCQQCGKWLSPSGSQMILYNGARLGSEGDTLGDCHGNWNAQGRVLWIVENPIDALLVEQKVPGACAVGILGCANWKDEWTEAVARAGAESVMIALDHDLVGCGGGPNHYKMVREWQQAHGNKAPEPNGVKLANRLLRAGVRRVSLFPWNEGDATKRDIGDLLRQ